MFPNIFGHAARLFASAAIERSINKMIPVSLDLLKSDPIATIGSALIQAAASEMIVTYLSDKVIDALDGIKQAAPELQKIEPQSSPAPASEPAQSKPAKAKTTPKI